MIPQHAKHPFRGHQACCAVSTSSDEPKSLIEIPVERVSGWHAGAIHFTSLADCSLIIPTYRRPVEVAQLVRHLLGCERETPGRVPAEVIIVDGSPETETEEAILALTIERAPFTLKYLRSRPGLTRQRNVGIEASSREFVFFLDDDTLPTPEYFSVVRRVFLDDAAKAIGAVGACVMNEWDQSLTWRWRIRLALGIVPRIEPMKYSHCGTSNPRTLLKPFTGIREVDLLSGCAFSFRREVFNCERFSNFFEGYSQGEDMEMSLRVGTRWKLVCAGDAKVVHFEATAARPPSFAKGHMEVRNRVLIWCRYSSTQATVVDKLRLLADFSFLVLLDLGQFILRPWKPGSLLHCAGVLWALIECVLRPPYFDERAHTVLYRIDCQPR